MDDRFIDVDFTRDPNFVPGWHGDQLQSLGELCGAFEDTDEVFDDSRIDAEIEKIDAENGGGDLLQTRIFDQGQEGSCVANAFAQAHETVQTIMHGKDKVIHVSAMSLYKRIGSSAQSGAMVSDGIAELTKRGILPNDSDANKARFKHTHPDRGFSNRLPAGWEETAALFLAGEYQVVRTVNGLLTALCRQFPVVVGRSGHSIAYVRPMRKSGRRVVKYANSWRPTWGDQGYGYDSESMIRQSAGWAVVLRTVKAPK